MNEIINKLQEELGIDFYYISRDEDVSPCIVYNYKKELIISDLKKESAIYDFFFVLIIDTKVNATIEKFEEVLIDNLFRNVTVNQSAKTIDGLTQISITASKNI